jgi:shikimate kinase
MHANRNIVLIGFMGTGKSSVGRAVAGRLSLQFLDMDAVIEQRAGRPISTIFATDGEPAFRAMERALVQELAAQTGLVVATGGGVILNPDNVRDFAQSGLVVCLQATPETILARVAHETHRPLLAEGDKMAKIRALLAKRQPLYEAIPVQIRTDGLNVEAVADRVLAAYRP